MRLRFPINNFGSVFRSSIFWFIRKKFFFIAFNTQRHWYVSVIHIHEFWYLLIRLWRFDNMFCNTLLLCADTAHSFCQQITLTYENHNGNSGLNTVMKQMYQERLIYYVCYTKRFDWASCTVHVKKRSSKTCGQLTVLRQDKNIKKWKAKC